MFEKKHTVNNKRMHRQNDKEKILHRLILHSNWGIFLEEDAVTMQNVKIYHCNIAVHSKLTLHVHLILPVFFTHTHTHT